MTASAKFKNVEHDTTLHNRVCAWQSSLQDLASVIFWYRKVLVIYSDTQVKECRRAREICSNLEKGQKVGVSPESGDERTNTRLKRRRTISDESGFEGRMTSYSFAEDEVGTPTVRIENEAEPFIEIPSKRLDLPEHYTPPVLYKQYIFTFSCFSGDTRDTWLWTLENGKTYSLEFEFKSDKNHL